MLDTYRLRDRLNEAKIIHAWNRVVGEMIARNTSDLRIRNGTLYIKVSSAPLRNELMFARKKILVALNREAGAEVISDIVLK